MRRLVAVADHAKTTILLKGFWHADVAILHLVVFHDCHEDSSYGKCRAVDRMDECRFSGSRAKPGVEAPCLEVC